MSNHPALAKRPLIQKYVAGKSFVDIAGLWGTKGETVTTALEGGASRAMMADIQPMGNEWWTAFEQHCEGKGLTNYEELEVDICKAGAPDKLGQFDFVHCAGLMYHVSDLFAFVSNVLAVSREFVLLSSVVMPDEITTASGTLHFTPDRAYLAPILTDDTKRIVLEYLAQIGAKAAGLTTDEAFMDDDRMRTRTGPWWWLFSGEFMSQLLRLYGMEIIAEGGRAPGKDGAPRLTVHQVLARKTG